MIQMRKIIVKTRKKYPEILNKFIIFTIKLKSLKTIHQILNCLNKVKTKRNCNSKILLLK